MLNIQLQDFNRRIGKSSLWRWAVLFPITLSLWCSYCCSWIGSGISMSESCLDSSLQVTAPFFSFIRKVGILFAFLKEVLWIFYQQNYLGKCVLSLSFSERSYERIQLQLNVVCYWKREEYSFTSLRWVAVYLLHAVSAASAGTIKDLGNYKDFIRKYQPLEKC